MNLHLENAFAWKFYEVPLYERGMVLNQNRIDQLHSDINIGFDKASGSKLLEHLEYLLRDEGVSEFCIPLKKVPLKSPHHLDDSDEIIIGKKISFEKLLIRRSSHGKELVVKNNMLILTFSISALYELFTKLYVNFEIYATYEDNIIYLNDENENNIRLVIWGVWDGKPIYY